MSSFPEKLKVETQEIPIEKGGAKKEGKSNQKEKWFEPEGQLVVDVYQDENYLVIQSAIAGIKPANLDISIEGDMVIIRGKREKPEEVEEKNYFLKECYWGSFSRKIILPEEVDFSKAEASMKEGILIIRIPKTERQKQKKIIIKETG